MLWCILLYSPYHCTLSLHCMLLSLYFLQAVSRFSHACVIPTVLYSTTVCWVQLTRLTFYSSPSKEWHGTTNDTIKPVLSLVISSPAQRLYDNKIVTNLPLELSQPYQVCITHTHLLYVHCIKHYVQYNRCTVFYCTRKLCKWSVSMRDFLSWTCAVIQCWPKLTQP